MKEEYLYNDHLQRTAACQFGLYRAPLGERSIAAGIPGAWSPVNELRRFAASSRCCACGEMAGLWCMMLELEDGGQIILMQQTHGKHPAIQHCVRVVFCQQSSAPSTQQQQQTFVMGAKHTACIQAASSSLAFSSFASGFGGLPALRRSRRITKNCMSVEQAAQRPEQERGASCTASEGCKPGRDSDTGSSSAATNELPTLTTALKFG